MLLPPESARRAPSAIHAPHRRQSVLCGGAGAAVGDWPTGRLPDAVPARVRETVCRAWTLLDRPSHASCWRPALWRGSSRSPGLCARDQRRPGSTLAAALDRGGRGRDRLPRWSRGARLSPTRSCARRSYEELAQRAARRPARGGRRPPARPRRLPAGDVAAARGRGAQPSPRRAAAASPRRRGECAGGGARGLQAALGPCRGGASARATRSKRSSWVPRRRSTSASRPCWRWPISTFAAGDIDSCPQAGHAQAAPAASAPASAETMARAALVFAQVAGLTARFDEGGDRAL